MRAGYVRFRALDIDQRRAFCLARSNRRFNEKTNGRSVFRGDALRAETAS